ncbi:MAG TPA: hypothetical protein VME21_05575 [Steroidobacteraceae bacterium]|nr:hypothetical protein [Steroidobacteraceae bacterium]
MLRRRRADTFSLSFLDCICCGFGAVILFYVMMSAQGGQRRLQRAEVLRAEVSRLQEQVAGGTRDLAQLRNSVDETQAQRASGDSELARLRLELQRQSAARATYDATSLARSQHIAQLQADIRALEAGERRLEAGALEVAASGQQVMASPVGTPVAGPGTTARRYITGLRLHGKHVLILLDRSASMLHEDVVSVIRLRNSSDEARRAAAKWRRTMAIVEWLASQLPPGSQYQIYGFNTQAQPLVPGSAGAWLDAADTAALARAEEALHALVPADGTSLINAFTVSATLHPLPDQIVLITDGLPTQGRTRGTRKYIDSGGRERLFDESLQALPRHVPVDTVLLPMQGDREAAHRFWHLADLTGGSLISPAKDWP